MIIVMYGLVVFILSNIQHYRTYMRVYDQETGWVFKEGHAYAWRVVDEVDHPVWHLT